jgi:hypothetical protein
MSPTVLPDSLAEEDSFIVLGYGEPDTSDHSLDRIISALVPSFSENTSPIPLPTYLGKEVVARTSTTGQHNDPRVMGVLQGRSWRGRRAWDLNYLLSKPGVPVKRREPLILYLQNRLLQT